MPDDVEKIPSHPQRGNGGNLEPQVSRASERSRPGGRPKLRIQLPGEEGDRISPKETDTSDALKGSVHPDPLDPRASIAKATSSKFVRRLSAGLEKGGRSFEKLRKSLGLPGSSWITNNLDATHIKPVIRAAVAGWISVVLLVIMPTNRAQAGFLIILGMFLSFWTCLGIRLANLARKEFNPSASVTEIYSARYLEARPTVICGVFLFIWTSLLLYTRARVGPGPYIVAIVLSCVLTDISLTTAHLFPYPYYGIGESVIKPVAIHSAISIVCAAFVLPESVNAQFIKRFQVVFSALAKAVRTQPEIFQKSALSDEFDPTPFFKQVEAAESALAPLAATSRLMKRDISWGRFGSKDFSRLHELVRRMTVRANGMAFYFKIMDSSANKQPGTPAFSLLNTPAHSPPSSRPPSPTRSARSSRSLSDLNISASASVASVNSASARRRRRQQRHSAHNSLYQAALQFYHHAHHRNSRQSRHQHPHRRHHTSSLFHDVLNKTSEGAVGVFESQRYLNLETRLTHPNAEEFIPQIVHHLGESSADLVQCAGDALEHLTLKFGRMNEDRFYKLFCRERAMSWEEGIHDDESMLKKLKSVREEFRTKSRHRVLDLYRPHVDAYLSSQTDQEPPPHLYLFQCYMYQYHLMFFAEHLCQMFEELIDLEKTRPCSRLWLPILPFKQIIMRSKWEPPDAGLQHAEDEDPDVIQGIEPEKAELLSHAERRDPDALPPTNAIEAIGTLIYASVNALGRGNAVFGFKAGVLSGASKELFTVESAELPTELGRVCLRVIGQLTLSRFRGDTVRGYCSREVATFCGGIIGIVMWYASTGLGNGNSYGLAAVCAVAYPFLFFIRLYYPAAPMALTIFLVTIGLVVGYSWQDAKMPNLSNAGGFAVLYGLGVEVAWKRFILVTIGVTVAFIFSYFPPSTTLRRYLRTTYATTTQQLGQAYCDVVSNVTVRGGPETEAIVKELIASRLKLRRSKVLMANVVYEFSFRGKWPKERYEGICEIQLEIAYLLSHLRSATEHLEPSWARAFLKRTSFLEPEFQGDVLAVINMISTSLRTGTPLPQVTPCPLLDRFVAPKMGFHFLNGEDSASPDTNNEGGDTGEESDVYGEESEYAGLPRRLTAKTLEDEQYLYFSVGVATAFGIVTRLDRLMVATKELVGEQFHITGLPVYTRRPSTPSGPSALRRSGGR
ncbi:hypothetical protein A7U60_g3311 [Sanghuangporus baumii]|uniref:ER transporter 6TM N-terminal domain-containing protein n=1 Tax=Sanghuangporus baumii TaxID=108892 RepID=A0A9Q5I0N4_SANBA|nr:hypothetical protein A7U60_g3311 [Sanghuangporus baumii]